jgi:hypothetical protein
VITILAPTFLLFRFPWLALGVLRGLVTAGAVAINFLLRTDPRLRAALLQWIWRVTVEDKKRK